MLLNDAGSGLDNAVTMVLIGLGVLSLLWAPVIYITMRGANTEERMLRTALRDRHETTRRSELDSQMQRALEMARTEEGAYEVVTHSMRATLASDELGEFLLADSSQRALPAGVRDGTRRGGSGVPRRRARRLSCCDQWSDAHVPEQHAARRLPMVAIP